MCKPEEQTNVTADAIRTATTDKDLLARGVFALCAIDNALPMMNGGPGALEESSKRRIYENSLADCVVVPIVEEGIVMVMICPKLDYQEGVNHLEVVRTTLENNIKGVCFVDTDYSERLGNLHFPYIFSHFGSCDDIVFVLRTAA